MHGATYSRNSASMPGSVQSFKRRGYAISAVSRVRTTVKRAVPASGVSDAKNSHSPKETEEGGVQANGKMKLNAAPPPTRFSARSLPP